MKKAFLIIGIILAFGCLCAIAFIGINNERYKIYMHPEFRADQYLLDTKTGRVWHLVEDKNKLLIWEPMLKSNPTIEELTAEQK